MKFHLLPKNQKKLAMMDGSMLPYFVGLIAKCCCSRNNKEGSIMFSATFELAIMQNLIQILGIVVGSKDQIYCNRHEELFSRRGTGSRSTKPVIHRSTRKISKGVLQSFLLHSAVNSRVASR
jgi:hypothetical protein